MKFLLKHLELNICVVVVVVVAAVDDVVVTVSPIADMVIALKENREQIVYHC